MFHGNCLSGSATSVRTEVLLEVEGFREEIEFFEIEDYDLWIRISEKFMIFHLAGAAAIIAGIVLSTKRPKI